MTNGLPFAIVLVDDDEDDRIFMDDAFLQLGYDQEVKKFKNAEGLFHYLTNIDNSLLPFLIVLDNKIAETEAPQIIEALQKEERYRSIPIVVCSLMLSPAKEKELMSLGVYACYKKGENMEETLQLAKQLKDISEHGRVGPKV